MRRHPADLRHEHGEERIALEEVLDGEVQRPRARVLLLDRLADHRGVRRERARVVGDEQRAAGGGDMLDPLDLAAEPVVVEEGVERPVDEPLEALGAAPVRDRPLGLDRGQVVAQVRARRRAGQRRAGHDASTGARRRSSSGQSGAQITSSVSHSSRFHGCDDRGGDDARVERLLEVDRRVVDQHLDAELAAAGDLVVGAVELVVRQPDLLQPARGDLLRGHRPVRGDLDPVPGRVPAPHDVDRARIRLGGEHARLAVRLLDAGPDLLRPQQRDLPGQLIVVGQRDPEPAPRGVRELVPVVVERGVDVDRELHCR